MNKIPVSLIIDDPAPVVSVYCAHAGKTCTEDGRPLVETYPNELLTRFCEIIEQYGVKGKFSVIPMPANRGDIVHGVTGVDPDEVNEWLDMVRTRVAKNFTIGPEMLTHHQAVDLKTGAALSMNERDWASTQNRTTLTPYIAKALELLKQADFSAIGVTSPWDFGIEVEDEYHAAISKAVYDVTGSKDAWFFLRGLRGVPNAKPWVALEEDGRTLVSMPATLRDHFWQTIDCPDTGDAYINKLADEIITEDGTAGEMIDVLASGGWPILITHWQSLMSNGLATGLRALAEVARRIELNLGEQVEWMSFEELLQLVLADKKSFPKPVLTD